MTYYDYHLGITDAGVIQRGTHNSDILEFGG